MRFLLNMNVPRELGRQLIAEGHDCRHVGDIGMAQATDLTIVEKARANGEVILTHDLDYGHLLAFSGQSVPSVVIFRLRSIHPRNLFTRLVDILCEIEAPLLEGAIVVMEDADFRIRRLPIMREE